jgi:hypothetical protein
MCDWRFCSRNILSKSQTWMPYRNCQFQPDGGSRERAAPLSRSPTNRTRLLQLTPFPLAGRVAGGEVTPVDGMAAGNCAIAFDQYAGGSVGKLNQIGSKVRVPIF